MTPRRWHKVGPVEVREILQAHIAAGTVYNGCTHADLVQRYGPADLKHVRGRGWYKLTTGTAP